MISSRNKITVLLILLVILLPFWIHDSSDNVEPQRITNEFVGYYQSNTCDISLLEVYAKNIGNKNTISYSNNYYAGTECFGKVTGLDKIGDRFIVSIGTNTSLLFLIQSIIWLLFILLIPPKHNKTNSIKLPILILPLLFTFQHISEARFYERLNIYYKNISEGIMGNYHLLGMFLIYLFLFIALNDLLTQRQETIINYLPFGFIFIFTLGGMNINFYLIILSYFGFKNILKSESTFLFNGIYLIFSFVWIILGNRDTNSFFDTDKLRGYINSSNNNLSLIFWVTTIFLVLNGMFYLYRHSNIEIGKLKYNFLITGFLTFVFGTLGSVSPLINFFNNHIFGQNKRGISNLTSIAGNTWRGFSASAESLGEFYGFVIALFIILYTRNKHSISKFEYIMLGFVMLGLYRTNNFAVILSVILILAVFLIEHRIINRKNKSIIYCLTFGVIVVGVYFLLNNLNYEYLSTQLLYEASLHSNFFTYTDNYGKSLQIETLFNEERIYYLINILGEDSVSTSLQTLSEIFYQKFNIPIIPNLVAFISMISLLINRSEMWGIFIAKYSPNTLEAMFGYGPNQLNSYLYNQQVRLDVPLDKITGLYLPHSSVLDITLFFGLIGLVGGIVLLVTSIINRSENSEYKYLLVFLAINLLKSDSILYINSFMLLSLSFYLVRTKKMVKYE
ncbi:MAG: hypothetical protein H8D44_02525 [Actinobacteria bacterium]|nr:hypothetical protein [Actinomycetota bacterium]